MSSTPPSFGIPDGQYGQLVLMRIDMEGSEGIQRNTSPGGMRSLTTTYTSIVEAEVLRRGGIMGSWQGDGAMAFLGTQGEEDDLIKSGEDMARSVLDALFQSLPDKRFRIGVASAAARFFQPVDRLNNEHGVILASRLEREVRTLVRGSVLAAPGMVFTALDAHVKAMYEPAASSLCGVEVHLYIPQGAGQLLPRPERLTESVIVEHRGDQTTASPSQETGHRLFLGETNLCVSLVAHPAETSERLFDIDRDSPWIDAHYLSLPIGSRVFRDPDVRSNFLTYYVAEERNTPAIQMLRFYESGRVDFLDAGWSLLPGWQGVFYPEALRSIIPQVSSFLLQYYAECLRLDQDVQLRLAVENIVRCERKLSQGRMPPVESFIYDRNISASHRTPVSALDSEECSRALYDQIIRESNLSPIRWGWGTSG